MVADVHQNCKTAKVFLQSALQCEMYPSHADCAVAGLRLSDIICDPLQQNLSISPRVCRIIFFRP